jgi:EmrB/QacA subfamily drug resistance transporter
MDRRAAIVLLAVLGIGVFLAGLELLITAVALPSIVADLADWTELRRASWVVNGYLLVYVITMPLAGRLTDLWGARRLFGGALVLFTIGSLLAGRAQTLDELIVARLVQAAGGGVLVPVATAAASHLFSGHARPRALGVIGALTFLGMAAGPFAGAAILTALNVGPALAARGVEAGPLRDVLAPAWRWVFYLNVPVALVALALGWAAGGGWDTPRRAGRVDIGGALIFSVALAAALVGLTLLGETDLGGPDPAAVSGALFLAAVVAVTLTVARGLRGEDPFLDPRLFRRRAFSSAALVSLLTGYALATAIIGGAVFVDRVLYGGPDQQRVALGSLAGATALGALLSGFAVRVLSLRIVTLVGLVAAAIALLMMSAWAPGTSIRDVALALAVFGFGFGLTVTPRSTAAVESAGRRAFGAASATVTVARMIGMAIGLAILTAYGSTTIDRLTNEIYATPDAYQQFLPDDLKGRPLRDGLVVEALEAWAAGEAARIMVGIFVAAAGLVVIAVPPALALDAPRRTLSAAAGGAQEGGDGDGDEGGVEPALAL